MAFKLGDLIIDRIQMGVAEDFDGNLLYTLTQLSEATIDITADSVDATDKDGALIKRFWRAKTGTFTATNALLNMNIIAAKSGDDVEIATEDNIVTMPKIVTVKSGETVDITGYIDGTVVVYALSENGAMGSSYDVGTSASDTAYSISSDVLTPPTDEDETQYLVKYDRSVTEGMHLYSSTDSIPDTIKLTLKALCVDPCEADTLRACYIVLPSFQPSPELSITLSTESTLDYSGDLQVDYCSADKVLYEIYYATEDEE